MLRLDSRHSLADTRSRSLLLPSNALAKCSAICFSCTSGARRNLSGNPCSNNRRRIISPQQLDIGLDSIWAPCLTHSSRTYPVDAKLRVVRADPEVRALRFTRTLRRGLTGSVKRQLDEFQQQLDAACNPNEKDRIKTRAAELWERLFVAAGVAEELSVVADHDLQVSRVLDCRLLIPVLTRSATITELRGEQLARANHRRHARAPRQRCSFETV